MIQYIETFCKIFFVILKFFMFTHIFHPLYKKCNVQKKIIKKNKTKIICKPKSIIAFSYFILLVILFQLFTFKIILFIIVSCIFGSLILYEKFSSDLEIKLEKYNKFPFIIMCWKIFHSIFTLIYICTKPINNIINKYIYKNFLLLKKLLNVVAHLDSNSIAEKDFGDIHKKLLNISGNEEMSKISNISEYIVKSSKSKIDKNSNKNKNFTDDKVNNTCNNTVNDDNIEEINKDINGLIKNLLETETETETDSDIKSNYKDEIVEKANSINSIFSNDNSGDIEDITITMTES